jgi:NAD(P)-dependent dehydrogenase (short-subunit alcohol dehydrogenase family)
MGVSLKGKVAIVTGGAQGIGYAVTKKLVSEGASVLFADVDEAAARNVERELGASTVAYVGDLLEPSMPNGLVEAAITRFCTLDIIVNNAGVYWDAPLHRMSDAQWQMMLDIHMTVPFRILRAMGIELDPARANSADDTYKPRAMKQLPLGRAAHISEAADTIYCHCSPLSDYVTGQVLAASGGATGGMS